jgi:hypothetical protein
MISLYSPNIFSKTEEILASAKAETEEAKKLDKLTTKLSVEATNLAQYIECIKMKGFGFKLGK